MLEDLIKNHKALAVCAVLIMVIAGSALPNLTKVPKNPAGLEDMLSSSFPGESADEYIYVDISGAVRDPGVYRMRPFSRMIDLINACGGFRKGALTDGINLAQALKDGDKIIVPSSRGHGGGIEQASSGAKVDINNADQKALETLPGIGPSTAKKILEYRVKKGPFSTSEDLKKVPGIGNSKFEKIKQYINAY